MSISRDKIEQVAWLARIRLEDSEKEALEGKLSDILGMVDQLQASDTDGITPMAHPLDATQRLRPDEVTETNKRERFQAVAPETQDGLYLVPRVVE
ncbi:MULTISPECIES: Asp-tRNA(Asn)/Glu-tRNA(Gln) amidotransferase subunit GatC [Gammaproteobacteria]|jgi:aspartyl-tRNA(Asn)/glutamyl-tRNA(Gln) amidotransferase subunit C|uniref:Aspartyl/glutamyl-tRNA(Asn/Gln) amidotransferase subunit C n=1 Tax=Vreelandella halophila TaxID=86177 RepID=A0A9X4Y9Y0_9GAMM|nr:MULTISPECIES: Asp-tRNA(Asn)/Glu-tRNA(Gln) amidotransferase subunit GatC [Gammaproteobacteria]KAA8979761.1 Asp-tRNA(Asn)/Glu-tRNA(Gln) amidotransferase subunit GatC [Halospina sp. K52047b]MYL25488.1 Asp-tRNA(Asn)/Glu-tRNA(Gln) amidotransferase subunit GatC [Halomonas utahensis]MYL74724.1 Asp-tRNA(Asn)/Glu-tRNA(Gln) amidotransferase subunit GatC [Halomonas sp. 22501_18_FS]